MTAGGGGHKPGGHLDAVTVAHPHLVFGRCGFHAGKDAAGIFDTELGLAEFTVSAFSTRPPCCIISWAP
jgi:hypothetical protein